MLEQLEGSRAVAEVVARCRPDVICAYPISPQTHIVEDLSALVKSGAVDSCEFVNVESEFAAMSVAIGASATGGRAYTATASQGLLFMVEAVYNAAGLGLPIVMTVANRAIGAPINIWNDHSDTMSQRDSGWLQLYAKDNQQAVDLHILAFRLAEEVGIPVMVCMDGFVLTHAFEPVEIPDQDLVDRYLAPVRPRTLLDTAHPTSIGSLVGPEAFTEVKYLAHLKHITSTFELPRLAGEFAQVFGRSPGELLTEYRTENATTVVMALGSVLGAIEDTVDILRDDGLPVGAIELTSFRPFPFERLRRAVAWADRVVVVERALAAGVGGIVTADVRQALAGLPIDLHTVVAGLGGRPVTSSSLRHVLADAAANRLSALTFLDLDPAMANGSPGGAR